MKLAIIADMHLGYSRFEEDALRQAANALSDAEARADAIIIAGDVFDMKIPKLETLKRAADIFSGRKKPIVIIHGNHERRSRDMTNPIQLLSKLAGVKYVHAGSEVLSIGGDRKSVV
ncbi:MAG: metallophosphoesterase family protein, partial [Candidatus ainarchaeum sp.]|nr:metallophosphoesterase family protein [Candidatus ainarchaeum sp.]